MGLKLWITYKLYRDSSSHRIVCNTDWKWYSCLFRLLTPRNSIRFLWLVSYPSWWAHVCWWDVWYLCWDTCWPISLPWYWTKVLLFVCLLMPLFWLSCTKGDSILRRRRVVGWLVRRNAIWVVIRKYMDS